MGKDTECGCTTMDKPYTLQSTWYGKQTIRRNGWILMGCSLSHTDAQRLVDSLNEAYVRGFQDCGLWLMPRTMEAGMAEAGASSGS